MCPVVKTSAAGSKLKAKLGSDHTITSALDLLLSDYIPFGLSQTLPIQTPLSHPKRTLILPAEQTHCLPLIKASGLRAFSLLSASFSLHTWLWGSKIRLPYSRFKALLKREHCIRYIGLLKNEHTSALPPASPPDELLSTWFKQRVVSISETLLSDRANSKNTSTLLKMMFFSLQLDFRNNI